MTNEYQHYLDLFQECLGKTYIHTFEGGSYLIEYDSVNKQINIWLEWSKGFSDWANNFSFATKPYKRMKTVFKVHGGFFRVFDSIIPYIKEELDKYCELPKIKIVGYSHGAALSMLCHEYCRFNYPNAVIETYAFGCPRVLKGKYSDELLSRWDNFTVIRNYDDIVTHVPPLLFGYRHVGQVVDLTPKGYYHKKEKKFIDKFIKGHYDTSIIEQLENNRDEVNEDVRQIEKMIKRIEKIKAKKEK